MKLLSKFNVSNDGGPRKFSFELTMSGLVSLGIVLVLGISWVFILGILVGRGYKPEEAVPELAKIMPSAETPASLDSAEPPTVLRPEELRFMEDLQNKTGSAETITVDSVPTTPAQKPSPALPGGAAPSGGLAGRDLADGPGAPPEAGAAGGAAAHLPAVWGATRASLRRVLEQVSVADVVAGTLPDDLAALIDDPGSWSRRGTRGGPVRG